MATASPGEPAAATGQSRVRGRRWLGAAAVLGALVALTLLVVALVAEDEEVPPPVPIQREGTLADLLGWIPATAETRRAYAVWTNDPGLATPVPLRATLDVVDRLAIAPQPRSLGRSPAWPEQFGYGAAQVTGWATGGAASQIAVLQGPFDEEAIEERLDEAGYRPSDYRGASLFVLYDVATPTTVVEGDAVSAVNAVALFGGRIVAAAEPDLVRRAIDAALGQAPALADDPVIADVLRTVDPASALMAVDQADHAVDCGVAPGWTDATAPASGQAVAVAYGRLGAGGERRTLVVTTFPSADAATAVSPAYQSGWAAGFANAGGAGGGLAAFGRVTTVSQTGRLLIAEIVDGRDEGWVRSGIRFAIPVCEAASATLPAATPAARGPATRPAARVAESLPEFGSRGEFRFLDLESTARAHGVAAPAGLEPPGEEVAAWLVALQPAPTLATFAIGPEGIARWPATFDVPLDTIRAVGESTDSTTGETVAVLVGAWNPADVGRALAVGGYASIELDGVFHYALAASGGSPSEAVQAGGPIWSNVAIAGDRIFLSASQRALRTAVDAAIGSWTSPDVERPLRTWLMPAVPDATAGEIIGVAALGRRCGAVSGDWDALASFWVAAVGGDRAAVVVLPARGAAGTVGADLDRRLRALTIAPPPAPAVSVTPVAPPAAPLVGIMRYGGVERAAPGGGPAVAIGRFDVPPARDAALAGFFAGTTGGCRLTVLS